MTHAADLASQSFVLLRLGERRFAVAATQVAELTAPSRVFRFPNCTANLEGVILRRGRIVPVCDVAEVLLGKPLTSRRFYLIAVRRYARQSEWVALPVTGDCELIAAEMSSAGESDAPYVAGWISFNGEVIEVLNLDVLTPGEQPLRAATMTASQLETQP